MEHAPVADPVFQETDEPSLAHRVEERLDVGVQYEVHLSAADPDDERIHRIVRAAPGPEPVREPEEVFLVDRVQHRSRRPLDDLVLQGGHGERALSAIRLGYVDPSAWLRPIRSPMDPCMQIPEIALEVCRIGLPPQPVHSRCGVLLEFEERLFEMIRADVVEQPGELLLLSLPCCLPYALQRL